MIYIYPCCKLVHVFYTAPGWISPYAKIVLLGESIQLERDIRYKKGAAGGISPL